MSAADANSKRSIHVYDLAEKTSMVSPLLALAFNWTRKAREEVLELSKSVNPDVVHWHNTKGLLGRPFAVRDAVSVYTAHDYYMVCPRSNLLKPNGTPCQGPDLCTYCVLRWRKPPQIWRIGDRAVIKPGEGVSILSPSEYLARQLTKHGVQVHSVLRNFVPDCEAPNPIEPESKSLVLYVGLLEPHKGLWSLLEAFRATVRNHSLSLALVGEGSLKTAILDWVSKHSLSDRVTVHGYVSGDVLMGLRRRAICQAVPSEWPENAPLTLLESLAMGLPALASNQGGIPEIAERDSGSIVFPAGDIAELSKAIMAFWNRRDEVKSMMRLARATYERKYTPRIHVQNYIRILNEVDSSK